MPLNDCEKEIIASLSRVEERVNNTISITTNIDRENKAAHKEFDVKMEKLIEHVNHENEAQNTRITSLEKCREAELLSKKAQRQLIKKITVTVGGIAAFILTLVSILEILGII